MTDIVDLEPPAATATWLGIFARLYDPFLWLGEVSGMRRRRKTLLENARGRVLELGAGTGLNAALYPPDVTEVILTEPEPGMRRKLARRLARQGTAARIVDAPAERLPVEDASVDTVVSTLVLCTVPDPAAALREVARVLRPDGELLFIEHVRADGASLARWQDRLAELWRRFAGGCMCNRDTVELMRTNGFTVAVDDAVWRGMPALVRPLAVGYAALTPVT